MMQRYCLILCRSLTYAQRSSRALERAGITAVVRKAPLSVSKTGCTYCVKLKETQLERALLLLDRAAIQRGKIYRLLEDEPAQAAVGGTCSVDGHTHDGEPRPRRTQRCHARG